MKEESKVLTYSMINNLIISIIKLIGGVFFGLSSLFADGMHTFSDFFTDIVCIGTAKITKKKPTKSHPFGFGKVEYLTNLFVGIILLSLAIFIIVNAFGKDAIIPPVSVLGLLLLVFILKLIAILVMHNVGKKTHSQLLITSVKESSADLYSTIGVMIITILLQFSKQIPILKYSDILGSVLIGIIVLKTAFNIIIANSLSVIGEVEEDKELIENIKQVILKDSNIDNLKITLIKYGAYYKLQLTLILNPNLTLKEATQIEKSVKKRILQHRSLNIKYVTIFITDKI